MWSRNKDEEENNILYELLIYAEWQQEPEIIKGTQDKQEERKNVWNWFGSIVPPNNLKSVIQKLVNQQMMWQFAVGGDGQVIAILQDQSIEIRSSRDDYNSVIGRCQIPRDPLPQWRKIVWSPDCSMLAVGFSSGTIEFFDLLGSNLFTIQQVKTKATSNNGGQDSSRAIAGMIFTDVRIQSTQWSSGFLIITYKGILYSYLVSPTEGYQEGHTFSFSKHYPEGITSVSYHPTHQLLFISGVPQNLYGSLDSTKASHAGITVWRFLADYPHYKLVTSLEDEVDFAKRGWLQMVPFLNKYKRKNEDLVFKLSISPSGSVLAAVHTSGALSLWNVPSLRPKYFWDLHNQEGCNEINPQYCEPGKRKKNTILNDPLRFNIADINWWTDTAIILARYSGAVTVSSSSTFKNLLGSSPEWFEVVPEVSACNDGGFLVLECESNVSTKKRPLEGQEEHADESSDEEESSYIAHTTQMLKRALYYVTDSERFQPPRKRPKILTRTYRLLCLKSTTPEELYIRKIDNEEYGEALALAKAYGLDCDLVYQRQWRKTPVSVASIQDYLSKITKRSWVLHECLERVPETIDAAQELLLYGLRGTDLETLVAIGQGEDRGRFITSQMDYSDNESVMDVNEENDESQTKKDKVMKQKKLLEKIDFKSLTLEQKQLCQYRLKLFAYLDKLTTYEVILGGKFSAADNYKHQFFKKFRSQAGFEAAVSFAQENLWEAVAAMFTYHGQETLLHRLTILSNFPETTSPFEYSTLLPEAGYGADEPEVYSWEETKSREKDWCEIYFVDQILSPSSNEFEIEYYENHKHLKYRTADLTRTLLTEWYSERAREIEKLSSLVENALELVKLGRERNVQGIERLHDDLITMEMLIYECHLDKPLSFQELEEMSDSKKLELLMSMSTQSTFVKDIKQKLMPFLQCCEKHNTGSRKQLLREYLVTVATNDLSNCLKIFENSRVHQPDPVISDTAELMSLALDCIYACERDDQLSSAFGILECLPQRGYGVSNAEIDELHDRLDEMEKHFGVADLLEQHGVPTTLGYLYTCRNNPEEVKKLLTKLTRIASHKSPPLGEVHWKQLLNDILDLQQKIYQCITAVDCYEILVEALLCSDQLENIHLAGRMMECDASNVPTSPTGQTYLAHHQRLDYTRAVKLVLSAAREYFNSSATLFDPCMNLARECLQLIEDTPPCIEEEIDLIASLSLLQEFSINILPLQVRLCEDRLELIKQALKTKPKAYKNSQKLLRLSYLLRVCSDNKSEREGKVLSLIANSAFEARDYQTCYYICEQIIAGGHEEGWSVCHKMGSCSDFNDIKSRCKLLSFSIAHCSPDLIAPLLQVKGHLELQIIWDKIKFNLGVNEEIQESSSSNKEDIKENIGKGNSYSGLWNKGEKTLKLLVSTTQVTKDILTTVGSKQFWKDAVSWIPHLTSTGADYSDDSFSNNTALTKQAVDAFYADMFRNVHISKFDADYTKYAKPDLPHSVDLANKILRAMMLKDTLEESENPYISSEVLLDLAEKMLSEDTCYSLALLLTLSKENDTEEFFDKLPNTASVLQLAAYYYALVIHISLHPDVLFDIYTYDSIELINQVTSYIRNESHVRSDISESSRLLQKYNKLVFDFVQAEILHELGGGIDVRRFTEDDVYKRETILGLAMTTNDSVLNVSLSLARHYNIPVWDIYMANLEFLFLEESLSAVEVESRTEHSGMLTELLTQPILFQEKLLSTIYPCLNGKDYMSLIFYYSLLERCGDNIDNTGIKPSTHLKILKKLKTLTPDLDYKKLTKTDESSLTVLYPVLDEKNVHVFAKIVTNLPDQNEGWQKSSSVYCLWSQKYFFEGNTVNRKNPVTLSDWLHHYETCGEYIQHLLPLDTLEFINKITFSDTALDKLSLGCRIEITKRAIKYCKQKHTKMKSEDESCEWETVLNNLQHNLQHLQNVENGLIDDLWASDDSKIREYAKEFDLSQSLPCKLHSMLLRAAFEDQPLSFLQTLLSRCPVDVSWEPMDIYTEAIKLIIKQLRNLNDNLHPSLRNVDIFDVLEKILEKISQNSEDLMGEEVVLELLRPFCSDTSVPVHIRLKVLQLLEKTTNLECEDLELLLLFKTQAMVATAWTGIEVEEQQVIDDSGRQDLFDELLRISTRTDQLITLSDLLKCWPALPNSKSEQPEINVWVQLITIAIGSSEPNSLTVAVNLLKEAMSVSTLSIECSWAIYRYFEQTGSLLHILKVGILTKVPEIQNKSLNVLSECSQVTKEDYDDELLSLILTHCLSTKVIGTNLYQPLIEYLLVNEETDDSFCAEDVVDELKGEGYMAEAGTLVLLSEGIQHSLHTFASSLHIHEWFGKRNP